MRLALFSVITAFFICCPFLAFAQSKNTLVVIGYSDQLELSEFNISQHNYFPGIAEKSREQVFLTLQSRGFSPDEGLRNWNRVDASERVVFLDSNVTCPEDDTAAGMIRRKNSTCPAQMDRSQEIKTFVEQNITSFQKFIFIGHSRKGDGLAVGPNQVLQVRFYNEVERGELTTVSIFSCDSNLYFRRNYERAGIHFQGVDGKEKWVANLLPRLVDNLHAN